MKRASRFFSGLLLVSVVSMATTLRAAEQYGDISVEPGAIYTGNTYHGYAETRVSLENHSFTKAHVVTLYSPNRSYGSGNSISRVSRSVKLEPGAREIVPLLQPPLPSQGDTQIHVEVDGRDAGDVHAPNANDHCNVYSRGGGSGQMATVFISRSLDFDAVEKLFQANGGAFTAEKAVGPPDAPGSGYQPNTWMPDTRRYNTTNWLELDYATAQTVNRVIVSCTQSPMTSGFIDLVGVSGTNIARVSMASGTATSSGSGWDLAYSFPVTAEPVKTVRLNFGKQPPHNIAIDAVQILGPGGAQWASDARASSDNSASAPSYTSGSGSVDAVESLRAESPVSEWGESWLAYTPFDAVVVNSGEMGTMPPAVLAALGDYLHAGGNIVLVGKTALPDSWHPSRKTVLSDTSEYQVGFGKCLVLGPENPSATGTQTVQRLREMVNGTSRYWQSLPYDDNAANAALPVIANLKIPTRGIVVIMLAFIVIIGPVNIIYLNRRKRRTWMLWTIPAISLVTTLLVFAYSLLREGITPDTLITGITVLDQTSHHAATIGGTAFYCPLTPSGGLNFEYGTEVTPLVETGYYGAGNSREVDWTQAQHFQRGWVSARVPAHFHLRKSETRRERIQILNENGGLQVVNSLGAPIKSILVADAKMNFYEADNVGAGQKAGLIASPAETTVAEKAGVDGLLRDVGFAARPDGSGHRKYLQPNTYIAVLDGNPFIENGLGSAASAKRTKASAVVFGILESPATP